MKKLIILAVAGLLAFPVMSYAGSATSRWDLTIGGYVKMDLVWADQYANPDITFAARNSGTSTSSQDKYNALTWAAGESRLNFLVKGPDTWGAKSSAFIEFDFRVGDVTSTDSATRSQLNSYGVASLRHAFMKFDWPTVSLIIGQTWTPPVLLTAWYVLGFNELEQFNKGVRRPEIMVSWMATKNFTVDFAVVAPYNTDKYAGTGGSTLANGLANDDFARSQIPDLMTELTYATDALGKIGAWKLQFGLGGLYGQEKPIDPSANGPTTFVTANAPTAGFWSANGFDSDTVDRWMASFKTYIPIIPERAPGKLGGSLAFAMSAFTGQNLRAYTNAAGLQSAMVSYDRNPAVNQIDAVAPVATGGWSQLLYYLTDTVWLGGYYGQTKVSLSQARKNSFSTATASSLGTVERAQLYIFNVVYDPSPAVRLGLEYSYLQTHYAKSIRPFLDSDGNTNTVRFAAQYFF
jgi:hypothetical protein